MDLSFSCSYTRMRMRARGRLYTRLVLEYIESMISWQIYKCDFNYLTYIYVIIFEYPLTRLIDRFYLFISFVVVIFIISFSSSFRILLPENQR